MRYLSETDLLRIAKKKGWYYLSQRQKLPEKFMDKYADKINWYYVSIDQKLSEKLMEKYINRIHWNWISAHQQLSEEFIEKHSDKVHWYYITIYQKLSEEFIERHSDKINWYNVSICQKLSEEFIEKHADKVSWNYTLIRNIDCSKLSKKTIVKVFKINLTDKVISRLLKSHNWSYIELTTLASRVKSFETKEAIYEYRDKNCEQPGRLDLLDDLMF